MTLLIGKWLYCCISSSLKPPFASLEPSFDYEFLCTTLSFLLSIMGDHFPSFFPCFYKELNLKDLLGSIYEFENLMNAMFPEVRYHIQSLSHSQPSCSSLTII